MRREPASAPFFSAAMSDPTIRQARRAPGGRSSGSTRAEPGRAEIVGAAAAPHAVGGDEPVHGVTEAPDPRQPPERAEGPHQGHDPRNLQVALVATVTAATLVDDVHLHHDGGFGETRRDTL